MVAGIVSAGIGALGSIGGALASNAMSSYQMEQMAKYQAKLNYKYWKKQQLNQPTLNRQGLEAANYNPMLALGSVGAGAGASSWSSLANPTTPDLSNVGSNGIANALAVKQQQNQNDLTQAQVSNYNADSVLKNNQAITEIYSQLEKLNHADLMKAQKILTDKNSNWYDKIQAREDLRVANEIERTGNDFKVGMAQAIASQIGANASVIGANASANMAGANAEEQRLRAKWIKEHPLLYGAERAGAGIAGMLGAGVGVGYGVKNMFNKKNPVGFRAK